MVRDIRRHRVRIDEYRETFRREPWPIIVHTKVPVTFSSAFASRNLAGYPISTAVSSPHWIDHEAGVDPRDLQLVHFQLAGETVYTQNDRSVVLRPGDASVYNFLSPSRTENQGSDVLILGVPSHRLGVPVNQLRDLSGIALERDRALVQVLTPFARQLSRSLDSIDDAVGKHLVLGIIDMVSAALVETARETETNSGDALLSSVLDYIDRHLHRPGLTVTEIAAAHFVSPRKLHVAFEAHETTVAAWIRSRRLENCRRDLADSAFAELKIADVAARWGYTDAALFSRQFAHRFGVPPRAYRAGRGAA